MNQKDFLSILSVAEKLKCSTRHSDTSTGRRESVAKHSWRPALMAVLLEDDLQLTYGAEEVKCSSYMIELKAQIDEWTKEKIAGRLKEN